MSRTLRIGSLLRAMALAPPFSLSNAHRDCQRQDEHLYASTRRRSGGRNRPESMDELLWNQWTICPGISGRIGLECVDDLLRNTHHLAETGPRWEIGRA